MCERFCFRAHPCSLRSSDFSCIHVWTSRVFVTCSFRASLCLSSPSICYCYYRCSTRPVFASFLRRTVVRSSSMFLIGAQCGSQSPRFASRIRVTLTDCCIIAMTLASNNDNFERVFFDVSSDGCSCVSVANVCPRFKMSSRFVVVSILLTHHSISSFEAKSACNWFAPNSFLVF